MKTLILLRVVLAVSATAATHEVTVHTNHFDPEVVVAKPGDEITWTVFANQHVLSTKDGDQIIQFQSPTLNRGDQYSLTVGETLGESQYLSNAGDNFLGAIVVESGEVNPFVIDERINAGYINPVTPGQGLLFEFIPSTSQLVAYWFTYDKTTGAQLWLTADGQISGNQATLTVYKSTGGQLASPSPDAELAVWGEMTLVFDDCFAGTAWFNASGEQHAGQFPLQRLYSATACEQEE